MMPIAGMMVMGMRPAAAAMMPAVTPTAAPTTASAQRPPTTVTKPIGVQRPPAAPTPTGAMTSMMPPTGVIVPRPADGLVHNVHMLSRKLNDDSSSLAEDVMVETVRIDSTYGPGRVDQIQFNSSIDNDSNKQKIEFTTQTIHQETTDDQVSTIEDTTELIQQSDSSRILKRKKRQYDIFDIFHQSNRCDRAYRICITRSNNYIVSRLRGTRLNGNKNKDMVCNDRPTKIVHAPTHNLCSSLTSTMANDFSSASVSQDSNNSNSQSGDTLDAIVVSDDSTDDSGFYAQNYPQIASINPYNRPRVFPMRAPPLVASQLKELLEKLTNDTLFTSRMYE